jgi:hypothetical protein
MTRPLRTEVRDSHPGLVSLTVGATGALGAVVLFGFAQSVAAQSSAESTAAQASLFASVGLLAADLALGVGTGRLAAALSHQQARAWPAVAVVSLTAAVLLGWGRGAEILHPGMAPMSAAFAGLACAVVGGWLGLALPPASAPSDTFDDPTIELRAATVCRPDPRPDRRSRRRRTTVGAGLVGAGLQAPGPDILDSRR